MSYSLKITNGDLDLSSDTLKTVTGIDKLVQDLSLFLREPYGTDRFHPMYGSTLDSYIGNMINALTQHELEVEVIRVLNVYQQAQVRNLQKNPTKFTLDELLDKVVSVDCRMNYDSIYIDVRFRNASGRLGQVAGEVAL